MKNFRNYSDKIFNLLSIKKIYTLIMFLTSIGSHEFNLTICYLVLK